MHRPDLPEAIGRIADQAETLAGQFARRLVVLSNDLLNHAVRELRDCVQTGTKPTNEPPTTITTQRRFLSVRETAEFLRIKASTVYLWASTGKLPHSKVGSRLLFEREALIAFVKTNEDPARKSRANDSQTRLRMLK
jgi:excisionase family DNA binding protein